MKVRWLTLAGLAALSFCAYSVHAQVSGKVTLEGTPPKTDAIDMSSKPECAERHKGQTITDQTVIVDAHGGLQNVVVSINTPDGVTLPSVKHSEPATLTQKGCMYEPHVLAMQVGQPLVVKNDDPFAHNVHSMSQNVPFNLQQGNIDKGQKVATPKAAEYFHVKCEVHPWMSMWIAVFDNGYFGITKADGTFEIALPKGFPDGDYAVTAWHEKYDKQDGTLSVKDGKGTVSFTFKADAGASAQPVPADKTPKVVVASARDKK
jgi:plastocyanin